MPRLFETADLVWTPYPGGRCSGGTARPGTAGGTDFHFDGGGDLNAVVVRVAELLLQRTGDAPMFMSSNLDQGNAHNLGWLEHYHGQLTYLG